MTRTFAITFDYLCPFARNANEHVIEALRDGADWAVTFTPFSLAQAHVEDDDPDVWDHPDPDAVSGVRALQVGLAVRDHLPQRFLDVHEALFAARHDQGRDIKEAQVLRETLASVDVDPDEVLALVRGGEPLDVLRKEHEAAVRDYEVWGVPTFIGTDRAVFVRLMDRPEGDAHLATRTIERVLDLLVDFPELHEFKQSDLPV